MKKEFKRILSGAAALIMAVSMVGCGNKGGGEFASDMPKGEISYPIDTDETVTYWVRLPGPIATVVTNFGETEFAKEYIKRTGINIEYQHPTSDGEAQSLNLLIASNELPDIIETNWLTQDPAEMIKNGVIYSLNQFMDYMPNLQKFLKENPDIDKQIKTDDGDYYVFPFIRNGELLQNTSGYMVRRDWLKELGMEAPETIDEWETMLEAMKTKCKTPISFGISTAELLTGGFGVGSRYYVDNGKIKYGPLEPGYKEYVTTMKEWYDKGYFDKNAAALDSATVNSNVLNGVSAVAFGAGGSGMGTWLNAMKDSGTSFDLQAIPWPATEKGAVPEFGNSQFKYSPINGAAITTQAKNPVLCARLLDYSYSEEGSMFNNFGIEGVSYEMKDGVPTYTDVITNNPDGLSMAQALPLYVRAANEGPFIQDERYITQYYQNDSQKEALEVWSNNNHLEHLIPQITLTAEESKEFTKIDTAIATYISEMVTKFITGVEPIEGYDKFVETIKSMNIDRAMELEQAALDRFNDR